MHIPKRRRRRERVQEAKRISRLQVSVNFNSSNKQSCLLYFPLCLVIYFPSFSQEIATTIWRFLLFFSLLVVIVLLLYYGYKGLLQLSDWMNEVEVQRQRKHLRN